MRIVDRRAKNPAAVGGKAAALEVLLREGLAVPAFVVVEPGAEVDVDALPVAGVGGYAVRSSATGEDSAAASFAGQFESFLNVAREDVPARVADVRARSAEAYQRQRGVVAGDVAVIVQAMVDARAAGVAFGADPVTGDRGVVVVNAVDGLADGLVGGEVTGASWTVERGKVTDTSAGPPLRCGFSAGDAGRVADLVRRCNAIFHRPQDVEWAQDQGGKLWLVQSRPITALPPDPAAAAELWDNANIVESYGGVVSPLTFSFARTNYAAVYRDYCRLMGVPAAVLRENDDVFGRMLGRFDSRVYYDLASWHRVLAMLPGYAVNRPFMEQMMGVREPLPADIERRVVPRPAAGRAKLAATLRTLVAAGRLAFKQATIRSRVGRFRERVRRTLAATHDEHLPHLDAAALAAHYRHLEARLLRAWDAPLVNDFLAMIHSGVLRSLCEKWLDDPSLHAPLVSPGEIESLAPARSLRELATRAARHDGLLGTLATAPADRAWAAARATGDRALVKGFERHVESFGDRCLEELKLESPTLRDDATPMFRSVAAVADTPERAALDVVPAAEAKAAEALAGRPVRRAVFGLVRGAARRRLAAREAMRMDRTRVFGRGRRVFVELGHRLVEAGLIGEARDVFLLELHELLGAVEGTATTADLRGLVELRRAEQARHEAADPPPERFVTRGLALAAAREPAASNAAAVTHGGGHDGETIAGVGSGAGVARGVVAVVADPRDPPPAGRVLVTARTDPSWVMLMASAAAIVTERGSVLSHAAIVARELGLPAVVGCAGATSLLRDGDEVEVNGVAGEVRVLRRGVS